MRDLPSYRLLLLLGLLLVLASAPLRLAEAASDQARTISELDGDVSIELVDGGVGDEPQEANRFFAFSFQSKLDFLAGPWLQWPGFSPVAIPLRASNEPNRWPDGPVFSLNHWQCQRQPLLI